MNRHWFEGLTVFFSRIYSNGFRYFMMKLFCLKVMCEYKAQFELQLRFHLPFVDWRAHSMLLFWYNTGRRRIEWEVWRWFSTPGTDESMAALSQTRAAMLWSVKQKYDPSKSLKFNTSVGILQIGMRNLYHCATQTCVYVRPVFIWKEFKIKVNNNFNATMFTSRSRGIGAGLPPRILRPWNAA